LNICYDVFLYDM